MKRHHQRTEEEPVRVVLLANQPRMFREMLHKALAKNPRLQLVFEIDEVDLISRTLKSVDADWLITTLTSDQELHSTAQKALAQNPALSIIGISADGSHVEIYERAHGDTTHKVRRESFDNISLYQLLSILQQD